MSYAIFTWDLLTLIIQPFSNHIITPKTQPETNLKIWLVGGWTNPIEKYYIVKLDHETPNRDENKKHLSNHHLVDAWKMIWISFPFGSFPMFQVNPPTAHPTGCHVSVGPPGWIGINFVTSKTSPNSTIQASSWPVGLLDPLLKPGV